jgi:selenocysteine lyase/cysteine desulfurase
MQGTMDYSRYLSAPAALRWVDEKLGGWAAMHAHNVALATAGAEALSAAWGGAARLVEPAASAEAEGLRAPFLVATVTPLRWRSWVLNKDGARGAAADVPEADAGPLFDADYALNERIAGAVLAAGGGQSVFFPWRIGPAWVIVNRISANVYNTLEEYERLAAVVLRVHGEAEARFGAGAAAGAPAHGAAPATPTTPAAKAAPGV